MGYRIISQINKQLACDEELNALKVLQGGHDPERSTKVWRRHYIDDVSAGITIVCPHKQVHQNLLVEASIEDG